MKWLSDHKAAALGFAVAVAYWPGMLSAAFIPRWAVIALGLPLVSTLDPRNISEGMRWTLLWLLAVAAIATTWASPDPLGGTQELIFMALLCLTFIAAAGLDDLDDLMNGLGFGLAVSAYGLLLEMNSYDGRSNMPDPTGLFYNTEILAEFAAIVFVWAILRPRYFIAATAALPIMICESRIAMVIAGAALLYAFGPRSRLKMAGLCSLLAACAVATVFVLGPEKLGSGMQRIVLWISTVYAWTQFGHGLGWYQASNPDLQFAHSDAIQAIAELGIGGFAAILIPIAALRSKRGNHAEYAAFIAVCFETVVSFPLHFPASGFASAALAGFLVSVRPVVCMGEHVSATENGFRVQRGNAADEPAFVRRGLSRVAVSVRSSFTSRERLCASQDSIYSTQGA